MKKLYSFSIALIVLLLMTASASAVPGKGPVERYTSSGGEAYAVLYGDSSDAYVDIEVYDEQTYLYLNTYWYDTDGYYHFYSTNAYIPINSKDFKNAEVNSANLNVIELPVYDENGNEVTIDVKVDWNGIKDTECSYKSIYTYPGSKYEYEGKEAYATATASINGVEFTDNEWNYAYLKFGKYVGIYKEK